MNHSVNQTRGEIETMYNEAQQKCSELVRRGEIEMSEIKTEQERLSQLYSILQQRLDVLNAIIRSYLENNNQDGSK